MNRLFLLHADMYLWVFLDMPVKTPALLFLPQKTEQKYPFSTQALPGVCMWQAVHGKDFSLLAKQTFPAENSCGEEQFPESQRAVCCCLRTQVKTVPV